MGALNHVDTAIEAVETATDDVVDAEFEEVNDGPDENKEEDK